MTRISIANALPQLRAAILLVFAIAAVMIAGLGTLAAMPLALRAMRLDPQNAARG
jgi:hypothetical protein